MRGRKQWWQRLKNNSERPSSKRITKHWLPPPRFTASPRHPRSQHSINPPETLSSSREHYQQVVHQATHSLSRFFLEVDAGYKQYQTTSRLQNAAAQRLEAQRAFHEEGRITIDRYLDAVSQYASAVAQEALFKSTYNIALTAWAEGRGNAPGA